MKTRGRPRGSTLDKRTQGMIRRRLAKGMSAWAIARELGLSDDAVCVVRDGHNVNRARSYQAKTASA